MASIVARSARLPATTTCVGARGEQLAALVRPLDRSVCNQPGSAAHPFVARAYVPAQAPDRMNAGPTPWPTHSRPAPHRRFGFHVGTFRRELRGTAARVGERSGWRPPGSPTCRRHGSERQPARRHPPCTAQLWVRRGALRRRMPLRSHRHAFPSSRGHSSGCASRTSRAFATIVDFAQDAPPGATRHLAPERRRADSGVAGGARWRVCRELPHVRSSGRRSRTPSQYLTPFAPFAGVQPRSRKAAANARLLMTWSPSSRARQAYAA